MARTSTDSCRSRLGAGFRGTNRALQSSTIRPLSELA